MAPKNETYLLSTCWRKLRSLGDGRRIRMDLGNRRKQSGIAHMMYSEMIVAKLIDWQVIYRTNTPMGS